MQVGVKCDIMIIFFNAQNQICAILMQLLMVPLWRSDQKLSNTIELVHLNWILSELQTSVKIFFKQIVAIWVYSHCTHTRPSAERFTLRLNKY